MSITVPSSIQKQSLSVLIPTYNHDCVTLVEQLQAQLKNAAIPYEIIVADDGSTDSSTVRINEAINDIPRCRYIVRTENVGRAAIRNYLARESHYAHLLFIDSDMTMLSDQFIRRYREFLEAPVVDGGVTIGGDRNALKGNLRYQYELAEAPHHTAPERQRNPYQHLHTANLLIHRNVMLNCPFDERFRHYGYEDVLLGKMLHQHHIPILHIDNPMGFCTFESNEQFIAKTEEGLRTLHQFQDDLRGYNRLLTFVSGIHLNIVKRLLRFLHRLLSPSLRRNLISNHPHLPLFNLYRLGYYLTLDK